MKVTIGKSKDVDSDKGVCSTNIACQALVKCGLRSRIYNNGSGRAIAEFMDKPIYYKDKNGEFREIDNTLRLKGDYYETIANTFSTRFMRNIKNGELFEMEKEGYKLGLFSEDLTAHGEYNFKCTGKKVRVADTDGTIDIEYEVMNDRVKENVIINKCDDKYEYRFILDTEGLFAIASEDGRNLEFRSKVNRTKLFTIPAPFMTDAAGVYSDSVYYEFELEGEDRLHVRLVADKSWLNDETRVFPVIIDPQIIVADWVGTYYNDEGYQESIFRYYNVQDGIRIGGDLCLYIDYINQVRIMPEICILADKIPSYIRNNMISAELTIQTSGPDDQLAIVIANSSCNFMGESKTTVNVTQFIKDAKGEVIIPMEIYSYFGSQSIVRVEFKQLTLKIEYAGYLGGERGICPVTKTICGAGGVCADVYLKDGTTRQYFSCFNTDAFVVPLGISYVFTNVSNGSHFGAGWQLSIDRKLVKAKEDDDTNTLFTYTDEFGDEYQAVEKYYYYNGAEKVFVNKNEINISANGKLTDNNGHSIYTYQFCNGYTLVSEVDDFIGCEYIEQRQEKQIQLEEYVRQYSQVLKTYVKVDWRTGEIKTGLDSLTEADYNVLIASIMSSTIYILMTESEALQLQSLYQSISQLNNQINMYDKQIADDSDGYQTLYNAQKDDAVKQKDIVDKQINVVINQARNNFENIKKAFIDYFAKEGQLELLYRQMPVNYLKGEDNIVSGFNKYGDLVLEADAYGNYIAIDRDKDGLITEVYDDKNTVLAFAYTSGKLASITDSLGRKVIYTYSGDKLIKVAFTDGKTLEFAYYASADKIKSVSSGDAITEYLYDNSVQLSQIITRSESVSVGKELINNGNDYTETISKYDFSYDVNDITTIITDGENNVEKYQFNENGEILEYASFGSTGSSIVTDYSYVSRNQITETTQQNSYPAVTVTRTYNDIRQITSEATDWQSISESVRVKTEVQYSYDLNNRLTEKKTCRYVETNGETEEIVAHKIYSYNAQGMPVLTESFIEGEEQTGGINYEQKVYDDNGNVVKTIAWNSLDSSSKFYSESEVAENGQVLADKDETGATSAEYEYISGSNVVNSIKYPNGGKLAYGRNPYNFAVTSVTQSTAEGEANTNDIVYKNGLAVEVKSGNTAISYTWDGKGRKKSYSIDGVQQATYSYGGYSESSGNITYGTSTQNLADGTVMVTSKTGVADSTGRVKVTESVKADGTTIFSTLYNEDGLTEQVTDGVSGVTSYTYDSYKNVTKIAAATLTENYTYNAYSELTQKVLSGAVDQAYTYVYKDNAAHDLEYVGIDGYKFYPLSDVNGRNTGREIYSGENRIAAEYITYRKAGDHATNMPASIWFGTGKNIKDSIKYKYDTCGNIAEIMQNGHLVARYKYDSLNRLIREDNKPMNKTVIFTYDTAGNITERCEYAYTSKDGEELSELACTHYSYDYEGDRLVNYNGESIAYNVLGNPTSYRGNATEWQYGTRLTKFGDTTFTYDGAGRRVSKGNISFTYDSDGRLIKQSNGLEFIYDNSGVIGVKYNNAQYFYRRDCQGNIIALIDSSGAVVVEYKYDAWGNHEAEVASEEYVTLANLNPFRYRGYYYDSETGLYYLQTRYYDPEVGRFISRDSIEYADPETICGLNLYAYCGNNPVMNVDPTGCSWMDTWWGKLLGWITTAALVVGAVVMIGVVAAGVVASGGLLGTVLVGAGVGILAGVGGSIATQGGLTNIGNINPWSVALSGAIGGVIGAVSGAMSYGFSQIGKTIGQFVGFTLNNARHIGTGLKIANVFRLSASTLMKAGSFAGSAFGGFLGGMLVNNIANDIVAKNFGEQFVVDNPNYARSGLLKLFQWLNTFR